MPSDIEILLADQDVQLDKQVTELKADVQRLTALNTRYREVILAQETRIRQGGLQNPDEVAGDTFAALMGAQETT
jgi:hypothetical protein